jgi:hypothetical protein
MTIMPSSDDVPVDAGPVAVKRDVGINDTEDHHRSRATQGGGHPVDAFGSDQNVRRGEHRDDENLGHVVGRAGNR